MSILQADGLEFGDGSILESLYGIIPQSKKWFLSGGSTDWMDKINSSFCTWRPRWICY